MNKIVIKMGVTPSNAPFRISNLRTFSYLYSILLNYKLNNYNCKMIFQIDDTNKSKRLYSDEEIIDFYRTIGILNVDDKIEKEFTKQENNQSYYEYYYDKLYDKGYIIENEEGVSYFNIDKYIESFGNNLIVNDLIYETIKFDVNNLSQNNVFAIRRSNGSFLYHYVSCIDNLTLELTHVVRGNNKIMSSAYQVMIMKCLEMESPVFIHLPLLIEKDERRNLHQLVREGYDYQPIMSYLLSSGYGNSDVVYKNFNDFASKLNIKNFHKKNGNFDLNILKKTQIRYYKNIMYSEYCDNIRITSLLDGNTANIDYMDTFYKYKADYSKIVYYQKSLATDEFEELSMEEMQLAKVLSSLLFTNVPIEEMMNIVCVNDRIKIYEIIQWLFTGRKKGSSFQLLLDIYQNENIEPKGLKKVK